MDVQAIRERLEKLTYRQLQQEAKKNGVKARGTKEKLLKNVIKKLALEPFDSSFSSSAADTTGQTLDTTTQSTYSKIDKESSAVNVDVAMNENVSSAIEEVSSTAKVAADTTIQVLDKADEESSAEPPVEDVDVAMNENVSSAIEEVNSTAKIAADTTTQVLDKADEESFSPPSITTTSAAMNENDLPKKHISGGSPLKSPGVARQRFIDLHQRAAQQMTDIETDQKRKEERHGALTRTWTPNINKLSKPKFATPSKKVPESPYKRRRSTTIEIGTPSKKRHCQGLTYPELTPRLAILAQPKTPPRPVSRNRAQSVARMSYTPRKGAYHFVDTTGMSDEKFNEYMIQRAEPGQS